MTVPTRLASMVDAALEASVVGSFTRVGFAVRSRLWGWGQPRDQRGRVAMVTGASSGIGAAVAVGLACLGGSVWLVGRDRQRLEAVAAQARAVARSVHADPGATIETVALDLVDPAAVAAFAAGFRARHGALHALVHAAGALSSDYRSAPDGTELTVATAVLAPFRLTLLLQAPMFRAGDAAIVTVSSGGMYLEPFDTDRLELGPAAYRGTVAYARAKRAQVVLSHEWARRWGSHGVASYAMHPGWVDTPGLASGLPSFARLGPLLRTPAQGADTAVWLAAGGARDAGLTEGFFHDRALRSEHRLSRTGRSGAGATDPGTALWSWCATRLSGGVGAVGATVTGA